MRKGHEKSVKEAINDMIDQYKLRDKINEVRLLHAWETRMGSAIAKRTGKISMNNKTLYIQVNSAPLKTELTYSLDKIKAMMNEELEGEFIDKVQIR